MLAKEIGWAYLTPFMPNLAHYFISSRLICAVAEGHNSHPRITDLSTPAFNHNSF